LYTGIVGKILGFFIPIALALVFLGTDFSFI
jgi:hypothetical protein